ncbi:MAG: hypothetical protein K2J81_05105 [Treponemataceae bacterium]|nr:hypothetical protein [Treponemataceae bacterium]
MRWADFRKTRKTAFVAGGFPHRAETWFSLGGLSAPCGSVVLLRVAFRTVRMRGFVAGSVPHRAEAWLLAQATFRKARKRGFVAGELSAKCGRLLLLRAAFRTVRKRGFVTGGFPHRAETCVLIGGGVLGAQPLGEGVFKKQRCCFLTDSLLCKLSR